MASIVRKKKPVVKAGKKRLSDEREAEQKLAEYIQSMTENGNWAAKIYSAQDARTQEAIRSLIDVLSNMADPSGEAKITVDSGAVITMPVDQKVFENGWLWIALRLMLVADEWGIQVANFHPIRKKKNV